MIVERILVFLSILERIFSMFMAGEKISDIKSLCFTDYAYFLNVKRKNYKKAIRFNNMAIRLKPDNPYAYTGLASAQIKEGLFRDALESCNKAISIKPSGPRFILQSLIYKLLYDDSLSGKAIQEALRFFDNNLLSVYNELANLYRMFNLYDMAEYYCREILKEYPDADGAHFNMAYVYLGKGQLQDARDEFQKGLRLTTNQRNKKYAEKEIRKIEKSGDKPQKGQNVL